MSKKSFIDSVEVKSPCTEDWEDMLGTDKMRFCSHCTKHVNNLSDMTRKEAMRMVRASDGNICIRYIADPVTKRPLFAEPLFQITRRAPGIAAGVMSTSIALSSHAFAQGGSPSPSVPDIAWLQQKQAFTKPDKSAETKKSDWAAATISGTITDPNGAVITNAQVSLYGISSNKTATTTTNAEGVYNFANLESGTYRLESTSPGFRTYTTEVVVTDKNDTISDASLGIGVEASVDVIANVELNVGEVMGGVMVAVEYTSPLSRAVADEDIEAARDLIAKGAGVNAKEDSYSKITPLFVAIENGNLEIVELLLNSGAKVNIRDKEKQTPLMRLDSDATPELIDLLIRHRAKVNLTDNAGNTALIIAARDVTPEVIQALIDAGADVRLGNNDGETALMNAAANDRLESVRLLIAAGADVNAKNNDGEMAWDLTSDDEVKVLLVNLGAVTTEKLDSSQNDKPTDN